MLNSSIVFIQNCFTPQLIHYNWDKIKILDNGVCQENWWVTEMSLREWLIMCLMVIYMQHSNILVVIHPKSLFSVSALKPHT